MPKNKDFKRLARSRMEKTGESYTAARARLMAKQEAAGEAVSSTAGEADFAVLGGMSHEAVRAKTGRDWHGWVEELDAARCTAMAHPEIVTHLRQHYEISHWWAQTVTVGYERIRGLRDLRQRRDGSYEASKSKTLPVPVAQLYRAFDHLPTRQRWLPGVEWTVRTASEEKSMRLTWEDGTSVHLYFTSKGERKSQVAIQHTKLTSAKEVARRKEYWNDRLRALTELLKASPRTSGS